METKTLTLAEFLLARLQEDYDVAWGAEPSPWRAGAWDGEFAGPREVLGRHGDVTAVCYYGGTYGHVLRFDPTRVLKDIEAKRRIVEEFEQVHADYRVAHTPTLEGQRFGLLKAMAYLALPYASHPDYRPDWRP